MAHPFKFMSEATLVRYGGISASNLKALLLALRRVDDSSIFYHLHHALLRRHFTTSEFINDFARWTWITLHDDKLAERLSTVDPLAGETLEESRATLVRLVREHLGESDYVMTVPAGQEFHFCEGQTFVFPTGLEARSLRELAQVIRRVQPNVIFHHVVGARMRLRTQNDLSAWIAEEMRAPALAAEVLALSPYRLDLVQMGGAIAALVERHLEREGA